MSCSPRAASYRWGADIGQAIGRSLLGTRYSLALDIAFGGLFPKCESDLCLLRVLIRGGKSEALMTELEVLEGKISEFKALLDNAWRSLSGSSLTTFERRELRNEMK